MSETTVTINGTEYTLSPLRCKHLREISEQLQNGALNAPKGVYSEIARWMPYITTSIKIKSPDIPNDLVDELTLQEFTDTWEKILQLSGIKVVPKGEQAPATTTGGDGSLPGSASVPTSPTGTLAS